MVSTGLNARKSPIYLSSDKSLSSPVDIFHPQEKRSNFLRYEYRADYNDSRNSNGRVLL